MNKKNITPLVDDLRQIINEARNRVAVNVNAELTLMYWHIGSASTVKCLEMNALNMENKLSRQCRDNCKKSLAQRVLRKETSAE